MNFLFRQSSLASCLKERNWVFGCCLTLSISNLALVIGLLNQEEHWVLMPQYDDEHRLEVTRSQYSNEYLMDWAAGILNTVLCANPQNIDWKISQLLKISLKNYGPLKERLQAESSRIKQDKISTAFYPNLFKVDQNTRTIEVTGEHSSWFGGDTKPVITEKTFQLTWAVRGHGVILLEHLKELTEPEGESQ